MPVRKRDLNQSDFKVWAKLLGFTQREVTKAGELIGIGSPTARAVYSGRRQLTHTERLAMAAVVEGLNPWQPASGPSTRAPTVGPSPTENDTTAA